MTTLPASTRDALRIARRDFKRLAKQYPDFRHYLIRASDRAAWDGADPTIGVTLARAGKFEHGRIFAVFDDDPDGRPVRDGHWFYDDCPGGKDSPLSVGWGIARQVILALTEAGFVPPDPEPPPDDDAPATKALESPYYYWRRFMDLIFRLADDDRPGRLVHAYPANGLAFVLPEGVAVRELDAPVFRAAALTLEALSAGADAPPEVPAVNGAPAAPRAGAEAPADDRREGSGGRGVVANGQTRPGKRRKEPDARAFAAYRLSKELGSGQERIAKELAKGFRKPCTQGQVSRMIAEVVTWLEGGNPLPPLTGHVAMAPEVVEAVASRQNYALRK